MKIRLLKLFKAFVLTTLLGSNLLSPAKAETMACKDAQIWQHITDVCWSCLLPIRILGVGAAPEGAAPSQPMCYCLDGLGVPEIGWQLSMWSPVKLVEVVKMPWCSPFLNGAMLQESLFDMGSVNTRNAMVATDSGYADIHQWEFPLFMMLKLLVIGDCVAEPYVDPSLTYISEVDPMWESSLLNLWLNPEAVVFANPITSMICAADCVNISLGNDDPLLNFCAGCDGNLYPLSGHVYSADDAVQMSSLLTQRLLTKLHRSGTMMKTMGEKEMCEKGYSFFVPRSQYRLQMLYPVAEAKGPKCCHYLGESVHQWSTAKGGRKRIGHDNYVYLLWRYSDCCVKLL